MPWNITIDDGEFTKVREIVEGLCQKATKKKLPCCSNLGDLHCVYVTRCVDDDGDMYWLAHVEEAAPDDVKLIMFFNQQLRAIDRSDIQVDLEW